MFYKKFLTVILFFAAIFFSGFYKGDGGKKTYKVLTNDFYTTISVNEIKMYVSNNGDESYNPNTQGQGLFWPGSENATQGASFEDGLIWGAIIDGDTVVGGSTYWHGLQAGKILPDGTADDPGLPKYRVFNVLRGWENLPPGPVKDQYEQDYNEWPAEDGAPFVDVNHDGIYTPGIDSPYVGDETLWFVANDLDSARTIHLYGANPIGIEVQATIYAFDDSGFLGNTIFKKYKLINKGQDTVRDMYLANWEDDDLGDANDDYVGCDTNLNIGYTYNGTDYDNVYGDAPPAIGHMFLQGPVIPGSLTDSAFFNNKWNRGFKNLPMTAFIFYLNYSQIYLDPPFDSQLGSIYMHNNLTGHEYNGNPFTDPNTGDSTKFLLSGDPVNHTGWYEGPLGWPDGPPPGDRRNLISSGPFTMVPGDTQEVVIAIFLARGSDNIQSVAELKQRAAQLQNYYGAYGVFTDVKDEAVNQPGKFQLMQNYPNPFNPVTNIGFRILHSGFITLKVYDVLGRLVATLVNEYKPSGQYEVKFNEKNLPSGIYFYKLSDGKYNEVKKMILMK